MFRLRVEIWVTRKQRKYFKKSASWLHHKIDGYDKDGNVVEFTDDEIKTLKEAFKDLSQRLDSFANTL